MQILIENYRSYDIFFDTNEEQFFTSIENDRKNKVSFHILKKFIDDFIKDNSTFEPFVVRGLPSSYYDTSRKTIVGIRKDGRFVSQNKKGEKEQVSDYNEKDYILDLPENEKYFAEIAILVLEQDTISKKIKEVTAKIKAPTLADVKSKYFKG